MSREAVARAIYRAEFEQEYGPGALNEDMERGCWELRLKAADAALAALAVTDEVVDAAHRATGVSEEGLTYAEMRAALEAALKVWRE